MKKRYLSFILLPLLSITACSGFIDKTPKSVINNGVLKANTKEEKLNIYHLDDLQEKDIEIENVSNVTVKDGFIAYYHLDGSISVYSLFLKSFLDIDQTSPFVVNSYPSEIVGGYLLVQYEQDKTIYDGLGNILTTNFKKGVTKIVDRINNKGQSYAEIISDDNMHYLYLYDEKGTPTFVASLNPDEEIEYDTGSSFIGSHSVSLSDYGHIGYKMIRNNGRIIIFDASNYEVSSFYEPECDNEFMVGDYIIYQKSTLLDGYNNNYDYLDEHGNRYALETNRLNYLTGQISNIDINYVLSTSIINPFFDENHIYSYAYGEVNLISKKKILSSTKRTYLIDSNGLLHDDVTGIYLNAFERISNSFYNLENYTLYDENLSELSILSSDAKLINNGGIIITSHNGLYGAINSRGRIVIPFIYKEIFTSYIARNFLFARNNEGIVSIFFDSEELRYQEIRLLEGYSSITYAGGDAFMVKGVATNERIVGDYVTLRDFTPINIQKDQESELIISNTYCRLINQGVQAIIEIISDGENKAVTNYRYSNIVIIDK